MYEKGGGATAVARSVISEVEGCHLLADEDADRQGCLLW